LHTLRAPPRSTLHGDERLSQVPGAASAAEAPAEGKTEPAAWARILLPPAAVGPHSPRAQARAGAASAPAILPAWISVLHPCASVPGPQCHAGRGSRYHGPHERLRACPCRLAFRSQPGRQQVPGMSAYAAPAVGRGARTWLAARNMPPNAQLGWHVLLLEYVTVCGPPYVRLLLLFECRAMSYVWTRVRRRKARVNRMPSACGPRVRRASRACKRAYTPLHRSSDAKEVESTRVRLLHADASNKEARECSQN